MKPIVLKISEVYDLTKTGVNLFMIGNNNGEYRVFVPNNFIRKLGDFVK